MGIAKLSAMRSKDPRTQVGACIVDGDDRILSMGYNGMPRGCDDKDFPWDREAEDILDTKYPYVVHAELNAILNYRRGTLQGSTLYVTLFPCNECAKAIIQAGIKKVVYGKEYRSSEASKRMFDAAGVEYVKHAEEPIGLVSKAEAISGIIKDHCMKCGPGCSNCGIEEAIEYLDDFGSVI